MEILIQVLFENILIIFMVCFMLVGGLFESNKPTKNKEYINLLNKKK